MIELSSTAHEFSLLNGLARIVDALPALFSSLNALATAQGSEAFTDSLEGPIEALGEASAVWLKVAPTLTLMTQTQADICSRLKSSEGEWLAEQALVGSDDGPRSPQQSELHEQLMAHGLLLQGFVVGFVRLTQALDDWVAKAVSASSRLSAYMQQWHDMLAACDPVLLEPLPWRNVLLHLHGIAKELDPAVGEWLPYDDVGQAMAAVRSAGQSLFIAPMTAAQHASCDLDRLVKLLEDSVIQLNAMTPGQTPRAYRRSLSFAVQSCDSAWLCCESLLTLMTAKGAE